MQRVGCSQQALKCWIASYTPPPHRVPCMAPPISLPPSLSWGAMVRCMGQTAPPAARIPQRTQDGELGHRVLSWLVGGAFPTAAPKRVCGCTAFFRNNLDACGQTLASPCSLAGCSRSGQRAEPCCQTTPASSPPPRLSPSRSRRLALLQRSDQLCELTRVGRASLPAPSPPPKIARHGKQTRVIVQKKWETE